MDWGLGIGDWGLGIGDWGLGIQTRYVPHRSPALLLSRAPSLPLPRALPSALAYS